MPNNNPTERVIALNGNGGAFVLISATIPCRRVEIVECQNNDGTPFAPQGVDYQRPDDGYTQTLVLQPGEMAHFGNATAELAGNGPLVGLPARAIVGENIAATPFCQMRSATAAGTYVRVREYI